ncbi:MAG: glycosyltransferase family 39 protein, partial [Acidobacteriota bacterium]|nr:glycosyltransferase family 39 protein [Acidobacteriota bacterium]
MRTTLLGKRSNFDRRMLLRRLLVLFFMLALAFAMRGLTMLFVRDRLSDPGWFQSGTYALFDSQAQAILEGKASIFWIDDPARTEAAVYPPGYPIWLALVYKINGERTAASAQRFQWVLDALSVLLVLGIGVTAYKWSTGLAAGFLAALSPLLALNGATPLADAPTSWLVLAGVWMLLLAFKRQSLAWAIGAGMLVGASCWFRANALLLVGFWAIPVLVFLRVDWRRRLLITGATVLGAAILVSPLLIRNAVAFRAFVPTGLGAGTNLWEGIGETDRAAEFGAVYGDVALTEQERAELGVPADASFGLYHPDGVQRDRARARKALSVIVRHPIWYAGVMVRRMAGMLKYAGQPAPGMGSAGINVTPEKTLGGKPPRVLSMGIRFLGIVQSVLRWLILPLALVGLWLGLRRNLSLTALL